MDCCLALHVRYVGLKFVGASKSRDAMSLIRGIPLAFLGFVGCTYLTVFQLLGSPNKDGTIKGKIIPSIK